MQEFPIEASGPVLPILARQQATRKVSTLVRDDPTFADVCTWSSDACAAIVAYFEAAYTSISWLWRSLYANNNDKHTCAGQIDCCVEHRRR
jgi:hypothetical protein